VEKQRFGSRFAAVANRRLGLRRTIPCALIAFLSLRASSAPIRVEAAPNGGNQNLEKATFAGGCFWCVQAAFDKLPGVVSTTVGYTGGHTDHPTYEQVCSETTGHQESTEIIFDPSKITYQQLLDAFWHNIDPLNGAGQFCDIGDSYRSVIFYHNQEQKRLAAASKTKFEADPEFKNRVATEIERAGTFWPAEEYHQKYYKKNPIRYKFYRYNCGRDQRLRQVWGSEAGGGD